VTRPQDELLEHEFDGIREYDNPPPGWIMALLYVSIAVAVGYWTYYHTFAVGHLPTAVYEAEMASAAELQLAQMGKQELSNQSLELMAAVPARVDDGRKIFEQFCVACHGAAGEGGVGPNLTDRYWIHGGAPLQIYATITNGVPDKGMVAWAGQLGPERVRTAVAYVLTLRDTNRPGKAPQGVAADASVPPAPASS
jgi:cytochrome c oxidase cbb3-type subunit III